MQATRSVARSLERVGKRQIMTGAASAESTQSIFTKMFASSKHEPVCLSTPFPGVAEPLPRTSEGVTMSTTESGIKVVSSDRGEQLSSVAVFVDAGSRYETHETSGITHFLEGMALKTTKNRTEFRTFREMQKIGASVSAHATREHFVYNADVLRENLHPVLGTFADQIQDPAFKFFEVDEHRNKYLAQMKAMEANPDLAIVEAVHEAAYQNNTLGMPLYANATNVKRFSSDDLHNYVETFFRPERMTVAAQGVEHADLVELVNHVFDRLPTGGPAPTAQKAEYTGGDVRLHTRGYEGNTTLALAFQTADWKSADLVPMCVLQALMGGGGAFSAGGPGKGMCSRLYERVLNDKPWVEQANCLNWIYEDSGLFGLTGSCHPQHAGELLHVFIQQAHTMGDVTETELSRAKNQLKSSVLMQLEMRNHIMEDLGRQLSTYGKVTSPADLVKQIDAVTAADVKRVASAMLDSNPTLAAHGDLSWLPRYDAVTALLKK